jgi:WD40 repeat protein
VVASCGEDGKVVWWDVKDGWPLSNKPNAHGGGVLDCRFGPAGELATCGRDGLVKIWSAEGNEQKKFVVADDTPAEAKPPAGVTLLPTRVTLSADGGTVLAGDIAGRLHAWPTK